MAKLFDVTTSKEWQAVGAILARWEGKYSQETIHRTADKLARRYHLHPAFDREAFAALGLDYSTMRQRYAAWKYAKQVTQPDCYACNLPAWRKCAGCGESFCYAHLNNDGRCDLCAR